MWGVRPSWYCAPVAYWVRKFKQRSINKRFYWNEREYMTEKKLFYCQLVWRVSSSNLGSKCAATVWLGKQGHWPCFQSLCALVCACGQDSVNGWMCRYCNKVWKPMRISKIYINYLCAKNKHLSYTVWLLTVVLTIVQPPIMKYCLNVSLEKTWIF